MRALALAPLLLLAACSKTPEPEGSNPVRVQATSTAGTATAAKPAPPKGPADVAWDAPGSWQKAENPSPMRKATYKIPKAAGDPEDAELSVSQAGGTVEMNVTRWAGQFQGKPDVKRSEKQAGDLKVTTVEIRGTWSGSGMPGSAPTAARDHWALLGAIVETTPPTFFKITGPEKTVTAARADFDKMVDGMRPK